MQLLRNSFFRGAVALVLFVTPALVFGQQGEGPLRKVQPNGMTPEQIIQRFAAKEKEFKQAREKYTWRQTIKVQTLEDDTVDGEYQIVFDVLFDKTGRRTEQVVFAPQSTLQRVTMTREDDFDLKHQMAFVLSTEDLPEYDILYVGQQQEDELNCYVFDMAPKKIEKDHRYFQGRIWVDDHDLQIVKTHGQTVPQTHGKPGNENLTPKFTTWREQVDGHYWFPTYTRADDVLHFSGGKGIMSQDVHIREIIKYTDYKRFGSDVKITFEGNEVPNAPQQGQTHPTPPQQQTPPPPQE